MIHKLRGLEGAGKTGILPYPQHPPFPGTGGKGGASRGFTLVEVVVVVFLISLFAVFTMPRLADLGELKINRTANHISHTVTYLYSQAVANQIVIRLTFDLVNGEYYPTTMDKKGDFTAAKFPLFSRGQLGDGITIKNFRTLFGGPTADKEAYLHLLPEGFAEQAVIILQDSTGREISLVVNPLTGQVRTEPGEVTVDLAGQPA